MRPLPRVTTVRESRARPWRNAIGGCTDEAMGRSVTTFKQDLQGWRTTVLGLLAPCPLGATCEACGDSATAARYAVAGACCCPAHAFAGMPEMKESAAQIASRHCRLTAGADRFDARAAYQAGFTDLSRWHCVARDELSNYKVLLRHLLLNDPLDQCMADAVRECIDALIHVLLEPNGRLL